MVVRLAKQVWRGSDCLCIARQDDVEKLTAQKLAQMGISLL